MAEGIHEGKSAHKVASDCGSVLESRRKVTQKIKTDRVGDGFWR